MSDREPRRRRKRKDSQKKDDVRSEDQTFIPTRSESKDSDQEVEEEPSLHIYEPSSFAKFIFVILFTGLVVSMSFIFISLHGTEKNDIDIFDEHISEEQISIENYDQSENSSLVEDQDEDTNNWSTNFETHDEQTDDWSPSEFFSSNIMDMLPNIGNIMSFGSEKNDPSSDEIIKSENVDQVDEISESSSDSLYQDGEIKENLDKLENDLTETEVIQEKSEINVESTPSSNIYEENMPEIHQNVEIHEENTIEYEEKSSPILQASVDDQSLDLKNNHDEQDFLDHSVDDVPPTISPSIVVSEASSDSLSEEYSDSLSEEYSTVPDSFPLSISDLYEGELESNIEENVLTSSAAEDDRSMYEKAAVTNVDDYEIREDLDQFDRVLEKNLYSDDESEEDEEDDDKIEDEFDFWQF